MESILNWLIFIFINGLIVYSSYCLSSRLTRESNLLSIIIVAAGIIYFTHVTLTVLFLGVVSQYLTYNSVIILSIVSSGTLIYFFHHHAHPFLEPSRKFIHELFVPRDYFLHLIVIFFVIQAVILLLKVYFLPPSVWDVFSYHLTPAVEWYQQQKIPLTIDTPVVSMNVFPLGMTVLNYWFFIFFRDDFLVEMPMLLWALLLVPVLYVTLREAKVNVRWAVKFSIVTFFIPIVLMQAHTAKDHLGLNISFIVSLLFISQFLKYKNYNFLFLAGLAFGLLLGYKKGAPLYLVITATVFLPFLYINNKEVFINKFERLKLLKWSLASLAIMLLVGSFWYLRNVSAHIKLISKLLPNVGGETKIQSTIGSAHENILSKFLSNVNDFFPRVFDYPFIYTADLVNISGFGPQFVSFGLLTFFLLVIAIIFKKYREWFDSSWFMMITVLMLFLVLAFVYYNPNSYRVLSFFAMVMVSGAAIILNNIKVLESKKGFLFVNISIVISIIWNFFHVLPPQFTNLMRLKEFISLDQSYRTSANYTKWFIIHRPDFYQLLSSIPVTEPIALVTSPDYGKYLRNNSPTQSWTYLYYDKNWKRKVKFLYDESFLACEDKPICHPTDKLNEILDKEKVSLVSSCVNNRCVSLRGKNYVELMPGFYYYKELSDASD